MLTYQYFLATIYLIMILFVFSLIPRFFINKLPRLLSKVALKIHFNTKVLICYLVITFILYTLTFRKPLVLNNKKEIIKKLEEEGNKRGLEHPKYKFTWDGCSGGISALYNMLGLNLDWEDGSGCLTHDYAYWRGGSSDLKRKADNHLYEHILAMGHNKFYAYLVWLIVAIGGQPFLPFPWRWGYGYPYPEKAFY